MRAPHRPLALLLSTLALAAAGCGGSAGGGGDMAKDDARGSNGDNTLAESDIAEVLDAKRRIDAACGSDGSGTPDRSAAELGGAAQAIATIAEQYPGRVYETGNEDRAVEMRLIAEETSEQLRRCGVPGEAARLDAVVKATD
ncbi:MAG: hypothetical protein JWO90_2344 [Solirubrobacterales bacterium]|jgi:hypothetical protein|nr:hypothetical protein [Solirubrobacterales bacterium]